MVERRNDYQIRVKTTQLKTKRLKKRFTDVLQCLKPIYLVHFGEKICSPRDLLDLLDGNCITQSQCGFLDIFYDSVQRVQNAASSMLKSIKNILRTIMCRNGLSSLRVLAMETELAKKNHFGRYYYQCFAREKNRKRTIQLKMCF